jgi:hypothetical protein
MFLLFFELLCYYPTLCIIPWVFVLFRKCLYYSPNDFVILWMFLLFFEFLSLYFSWYFVIVWMLTLFNVYCAATHHFIGWQVSRRLPLAETQPQSHGDPYGISDDVRRIVCLSRIDSIPFSETCDRDCERCLEVTCWQAFLKSALEFSVIFIIPPLVHWSIFTCHCSRSVQEDLTREYIFLTLAPQLFYRFWHLKMQWLRTTLLRDIQNVHISHTIHCPLRSIAVDTILTVPINREQYIHCSLQRQKL